MTGPTRAVVLDRPGGIERLQVVERPVPEPPSEWVRIKVEAFGLNRSEPHTRLGLAQASPSPGFSASRPSARSTSTPGGFSPGARRSRP